MWLMIDETMCDHWPGSWDILQRLFWFNCTQLRLLLYYNYSWEFFSFLRFTLYVIMTISWNHSFHPFTMGCWGYSKCILLNINNVPVFFLTDLNMSVDCVLFFVLQVYLKISAWEFEIITVLLTPAGLKKTLLVSCVCLSPEMPDSFWLAPHKSLLKKM